MIDLGCCFQIVRPGIVRIDQEGYQARNYSADQLQDALASETVFRRALALQEGLDLLSGGAPGKYDTPVCLCLERIGDNGDCPVHGKGLP
jgi:hypothetical protein